MDENRLVALSIILLVLIVAVALVVSNYISKQHQLAAIELMGPENFMQWRACNTYAFLCDSATWEGAKR